jgi:hypothetical protein
MTVRFKALAATTFLCGLAVAGAALAQAGYTEVPAPGAAYERTAPWRSDVVELTLQPAGDILGRHETEYMVHMRPDDVLVYSLVAEDTTGLYHEFHGHTGDKVTFYKKATGTAHHGALKAPFEGEHGWYLENRSDKPVKVQLKLSGFYRVLAGS